MKKGKLTKILASGAVLLFAVAILLVYLLGFNEPAQSVEEAIQDKENLEEQLSKEVDRVDQTGGIDKLPGIVDDADLDKEPAEEEKDNVIVDKSEQKDESTQTPQKPVEPEKPIGNTKPIQPDKPKVDIPAPIPKPNAD